MNRPDMQTQNHQEEQDTRMYYGTLANKYHRTKKWMIAFLTIFLFLMIVFGHSQMKSANFSYLWKYQTVNAFTLSETYRNVSHSAGNGASFALYKGDLAVLGEDKLSLYRLDDELIYKIYTDSSSSVLLSSEKYMATYVSGGKKLSVYDSFSLIQEMFFEETIGLAALSNDGSFTVYTKGNDAKMTVFDRDFQEIFSFSCASRAVMDMAFSADGEKLALITLGVSGGSFDSELLIFDLQTKKMEIRLRYDKKQAVNVSFFDDGRFFVSVGGTIFFYDRYGEAISSISRFQNYENDGNRLAVLSVSGEIVVYSSKGESMFRITDTASATRMILQDSILYIISDARLIVYQDGAPVSFADIRQGVLDFFVLDDGSILLCYSAETNRVIPKKE